MATRDKVAPGLLAVALATNYALSRTGHADTICINGRRALRTDTELGRAAAVLGWAAFSCWFVPHLINGPLQRS